MARFTGGWYKVHRDILEKDLVQNVYLWGLWHYLLSIAVYKDSQLIWNGQQRILKPGSCVLGVKELAKQWQCSKMTIWKWLNYLQKTERIVIETCTRGTLVTICNWSIYQISEEQELTPNRHQVDAKCTPSGHEVALSEEGKKERMEERKKRRESTSLPPLALLWNEFSDSNLPRVTKVDPSGKRGKALARRWESNSDPEYWKQLIERINKSKFCLGANDRGWKADIDWLSQPDVAAKILEGKYDDRIGLGNGKLNANYFDFLKGGVA